MNIAGRPIGPGHPCYIIAEISANHNQSYDEAEKLVRLAKEVGADAVKIQTYTADTITLDCEDEPFQVKGGTLWDGTTLHKLYQEAYTPWDWQPRLLAVANSIGIPLFSSPFDHTAVDFLEGMGVPAYKIASFELVDIPLIEKCAATGKPMIMSTGMATWAEIDDAVRAARGAGCTELALLHCNSGYPAPPSEMNLRTIPVLGSAFQVPAGLSDHTLGHTAAVAAVALGACILEKHFTSDRSHPGPDSAFSLEPAEFKALVEAVRECEAALGGVRQNRTAKEESSKVFRRSLFVVEDIASGEQFTEKNLRSIRPAHGLATKFQKEVIGKRASRDIKRGTPLSWDLVQ